VRDRLRAENLVARLQLPVPDVVPPVAEDRRDQPGGSPTAASPAGPALPFVGPSRADLDRPLVGLGAPPPADPTPVIRDAPAPARPAAAGPPPPAAPPQWPAPTDLLDHNAAKVIQLYDAYLVVETPEGMLVIDQHALHERILFEQFKRRLREGPLESQRLLIPEPVELTAEQAARTLEHQDALRDLGLDVADFGGGTVLLTGYPAMLGKRQPSKVLRAVVDHLMGKDRLPTREVLLNDLLSLMACHAAVRSGDRLTSEEMQALVAQRELVDDTHHCPHGRPTALLFSRQELDRQFRRT
jgi:DNA mismatch repair protein MutL